jgi:membrane protein DedA with SNARE-associated domain
MIQTLIDWLVSVITTLGYPGVALAVFIESFFAPIPSELILPFSGFVASTGALNVYIVILAATLGAYLGTLPFYLLGRWGEEYVQKFLDKYGKYLFIDKKDVEWAFDLFDKHGNKLILFGRLIPIVRSLISFPAGVAKMRFLVFSIYTMLGALIWNSMLVSAGYFLADNWDVVGEWVERYERVIIVFVVLVFTVYIIRGLRRTFKTSPH